MIQYAVTLMWERSCSCGKDHNSTREQMTMIRPSLKSALTDLAAACPETAKGAWIEIHTYENVKT